jgi:hypothetical protein
METFFICFFLYACIALMVSLVGTWNKSVPAHPMVGFWWPVLFIKGLYSSFVKEVLRK